jgi:predicted histidine transporter YuiF (NhaC family)
VIGKKTSIIWYFIAGIILIIGIIWSVYFIYQKDRAEFKETGSKIYT